MVRAESVGDPTKGTVQEGNWYYVARTTQVFQYLFFFFSFTAYLVPKGRIIEINFSVYRNGLSRKNFLALENIFVGTT